MKKLFILLITLVSAMVCFSFLLRNSLREQAPFSIYIDDTIDEESISFKEIVAYFRKQNKEVLIRNFQPVNFDSYLISTPHSLFITQKELKTKLFSLHRFEWVVVPVAVTTREGFINSLSFEELRKFENLWKPDNSKLSNKELVLSYGGIAVIPYKRLTLDVKPLNVDGVYPSVRNVRTGYYPVIESAIAYCTERRIARDCERFLARRLNLQNMFSIIAGGDIMLARGVSPYIDRNGPKYPFLHIQDELRSNDVACANLESPITETNTRFYPNKGIYFKAEPRVVEGLKASGLDFVSLGNNHILDWGWKGAHDTMEYLKEYSIRFTGVGENPKSASNPVIFLIAGTRIALLSVNDVYPLQVTDINGSMYTCSFNNNLKKTILNLKKKYDVVIVLYHGGEEYVRQPERSKIKKMHQFIEWGANLVLGSHPHVIQGIEIYKGGLIAYSLGNLIFDQNWSPETMTGLLLEVGFIRNKPCYYYPMIVSIDHAQATIVHGSKDEKIVKRLLTGRIDHEYAKN